MEDFTKDTLLKNIFKKTGLEQPSGNFTENVMHKIQAEFLPQKAQDEPVLSLQYWLLIGFGFAVAAVFLFSMDWSFMESFFHNLSFEWVQMVSAGNFLTDFKTLFSQLHLPNMLIIAMVVVLILIGIDRILKKSFSAHIFVF